MNRTTSETLSGRALDYADPRPEAIDLGDVATGLSNACRFAGQLDRFCSVAEHSVLVRRLVIDAGWPELGFAALFHDGHEAYTGDVPSPMKALLEMLASGAWSGITDSLDAAIGGRFGIDAALFHHPAVKDADTFALRIEAAAMKDATIVNTAEGWVDTVTPPAWWWTPGWAPDVARSAFLDAYGDEMERRASYHAAIARGWSRYS